LARGHARLSVAARGEVRAVTRPAGRPSGERRALGISPYGDNLDDTAEVKAGYRYWVDYRSKTQCECQPDWK
jgi:hypothetical protein